MASYTREIKEIVNALYKLGWRIRYNGRHYVVFPLDKAIRPCSFSATPSDFRAILNIKSDLKKRGVSL